MSNNAIPTSYSSDQVSHISCVYAISGSYGLLPRLLYYVTLVLAIFGRSKEWLIIGALVSALTYAGTASIHMMALCSSKSGVFDLDIMAAWAILSTGALGYIGMIHWSSTLRYSNAKWIMICWGMLVGIGLIFGRAVLFDSPKPEAEPSCYSTSGKLLEYPIELISPEFKCTYKCFSISKPMRHTSEIMAVPSQLLNNTYTGLALVLVGPIQFAAYAALSLDTQQHNPSQLCQRAVMKYLIHPGHKDQLTKTVYHASSDGWYGGYFALLSYLGRTEWTVKKTLICSITVPWLFLTFLIDVFCLPMMVTNIILNEITLLQGDIPTNESNINVGQWGAVVNSLLVVIAACMGKLIEMRQNSQKAKVLRLEQPHGTVTEVPSDLEQGFLEEQVTGVVKPKLAHVPTLQDMEHWIKKSKG
ncbi:uncharacterized protein A1O9_06257 [Exophiala aquamarina CBS 119918]|uniref:Uncharacterized protein n=1 Tax=Exophiala aquamarina CBS 119918 TaxID=1182545 RepID=A0A072PER5_9EURO|nr:uncharacterized protein A1O9_06257 [Exophiala aquamarina CBS 119918]KEF58331.1 hypothetical protein A1O9_06257 [Exophiala aquamarina CBS 119918]